MDNFFLDILSGFWQVIAVIFHALSPLIIGLVLAYLFNPAVEWVRFKIAGNPTEPLPQETPKGRGAAIFITYTAVLMILLLIIYAFVVLILGALPSGGIEETAANVYDYFESSFESITSFISQYADVSQFKSALADWIRDKFSFTGIIQFITTFAGSLISLFIGLVASIYLLKDKEFFLSLWQKFLSMILKQKVHGVTNEILGEINNVLTTFIKGALIDSLIVAFLSSLALSLVKVEYAVIIGIIGGLLNIIPYFGPFFGMVPAFLVALTTNGLGQAIIAVLALLGVQQIDSNYIYPKVVGSSTGLHPLFVLLSVSIFGYFGGILGMLLAVPAAGLIQILIKKWAYR